MKLDYQGQGELGKLDITRLTKELNLRFFVCFFLADLREKPVYKMGLFFLHHKRSFRGIRFGRQ